jgi:outer membrane lipoprotein-sorting protein
MKTDFMRIRVAIVLSVLIPATAFPATTDSVDDVIARLDRGAGSFKAFSADLQSVAHTAVINEDATDTGRILLKRAKHDMAMLVEFTAPNVKSIAVHDHKAEIYYPRQRTIEEYDIGHYRPLLDQFMLVGFGTSGKELATAYDVKVLGSETVDGKTSTHLELIPKSAEVLKNLKKLELWIPESEAYPVQQKFHLPAGDYKLFTYTNVKVNPPLGDSDLKIKAPKDTKRVLPQT